MQTQHQTTPSGSGRVHSLDALRALALLLGEARTSPESAA